VLQTSASDVHVALGRFQGGQETTALEAMERNSSPGPQKRSGKPRIKKMKMVYITKQKFPAI